MWIAARNDWHKSTELNVLLHSYYKVSHSNKTVQCYFLYVPLVNGYSAHRVKGSWSFSKPALGEGWGFTLDKSPVYYCVDWLKQETEKTYKLLTASPRYSWETKTGDSCCEAMVLNFVSQCPPLQINTQIIFA